MVSDEEIHRTVREWVHAWGGEVARADIAAGRQRFSAELTAFGTHADVVRGRHAVEERQWSQVWPAIEDFAFDLDDLEVVASPDGLQAVAVTTWKSTGIAPDGSRFARPGRATIVLVRPSLGRPWVGVHTHFSLARGVPDASYGSRPVIR